MYSNVIQSDLTGKEKAHLYFIMTYAKGDTSVITFQALQNYMGHIGNYPKERTRKILRRLKEKGYIRNFSDDFNKIRIKLAYESTNEETLLFQSKFIRLSKGFISNNMGKYTPILISIIYCNRYVETPTVLHHYVKYSGYAYNTFIKHVQDLIDTGEVIYNKDEMKYYIDKDLLK